MFAFKLGREFPLSVELHVRCSVADETMKSATTSNRTDSVANAAVTARLNHQQRSVSYTA